MFSASLEIVLAVAHEGVGGEEDAPGLADRFQHRPVVEGDQAAGVDQLGPQAVALPPFNPGPFQSSISINTVERA